MWTNFESADRKLAPFLNSHLICFRFMLTLKSTECFTHTHAWISIRNAFLYTHFTHRMCVIAINLAAHRLGDKQVFIIAVYFFSKVAINYIIVKSNSPKSTSFFHSYFYIFHKKTGTNWSSNMYSINPSINQTSDTFR